MDRADDRGVTATTRVQPAPRVTLDWQAVPFTCRGKVETKWTREKNGRKVLQLPKGGGKVKYWRAPRPRPRLYRRRKRQCKKTVLHKTMSQEKIVPVTLTEAQVAIQVLQGALRAALLREQGLQEQLRLQTDKTSAMVPEQPGDAALQRSEVAESGFKGVTRNKSGWAAHTKRCAGYRKHLGTFETPIEAARARSAAETVAVVHEASTPAPRGEFDVETFRLIPIERRTEWERQCIQDADVAAAACEAEAAAYLEQKKRSDAADFAYIAAQDRAAFWNAVLEMLFTPQTIVVLMFLMALIRSLFVP